MVPEVLVQSGWCDANALGRVGVVSPGFMVAVVIADKQPEVMSFTVTWYVPELIDVKLGDDW